MSTADEIINGEWSYNKKKKKKNTNVNTNQQNTADQIVSGDYNFKWGSKSNSTPKTNVFNNNTSNPLLEIINKNITKDMEKYATNNFTANNFRTNAVNNKSVSDTILGIKNQAESNIAPYSSKSLKSGLVTSDSKVRQLGQQTKEGYKTTGKVYGDYFYQGFKDNKNLPIVEKDGKYYVYNENAPSDALKYQDVDKMSFLSSGNEYKEAVKQGYKGSQEVRKISNQIKLDTEDLTSEEKEEYLKDIQRQEKAEEKQQKHDNRVRYGGAGLKGSLGELEYLFGNVSNNVEKKVNDLEDYKTNYDLGAISTEMGLEAYKKMSGEDNNYDEVKRKYNNYIKFNEKAVSKEGMLDEYFRNLPNQVEGFKAGIKGGGIGAGVGAGGGAIVGAILGGTTTGGTGAGAGALTGAKVGAKWLGGAGYVAGQTKYTYELEAGMQYQTLIDMGVPEDIAKKEAKRVGTTNALIESGESLLDLFTLGKASAGKELLKQGLVKKYGLETVSKWVGVSTVQNVVTEGTQEGLQEKVAINSEIRATDEAGIERDSSGDKDRIIDSVKSGAFSALITGGGMYVASKGVNKGTQKVIDYSNNKKIDSIVNDQISNYEAKTGITLDENQRNEIRNEVVTQLKQENKQPTNINNQTKTLSEEEKALSQQQFVYEVKDTDSTYRQELAKSTDVLNNSTAHHELFELASKVSEDTKTTYRFTNDSKEEMINEKNRFIENFAKNENISIEEARERIQDLTIDGFVNDKGEVIINADSKKALNVILGHETTHLFEGTKEYDTLQKALFKLADTKGDLNQLKENMTRLYEGTNANIDNEITSELAGEYLYTNQDFINNLATEQPNVFQRIYNYLNHLYKKITADSKEARQLEEVLYRYKQAYNKISNTTTKESKTNLTTEVDSNTLNNDNEVKISTKDNKGRTLSKEQQDRFKDSKVKDENGNLLTMYHGTRSDFNVFDLEKSGQNYEDNWSMSGKGFYFTKDYDSAYEYSEASVEGNERKVKEVYLDIKNPFYGYDNYTNELSSLKDKYKLNDNDLATGQNLISALNRKGHDSTKVLQELGYDGIIDVFDGQIEDAVVYNSNQIKNVDNTKPTDSEDIRYSISKKGTLVDDKGKDVKLEVSNIDNKTLMVMHGITASKLKGLMELGGIPVGSLAITKSDADVIQQYGDYVFLFNKDTIDPSNKQNEVYGSDVYSPRFPQTVQKVNEKELKKLQNYLGKNVYADDTTLEDFKSNHRNDIEFVDKFLEENNIKVEDVYKDADDNYGFSKNEKMKQFVLNNDVTYEKLFNDNNLRKQFYDIYRESSPMISFAERKIETWENTFNQGTINVNASSRFDADFNSIKNGAEKVIDVIETNKAKRELIKEQYNKEYYKFLDNKLSPVFEGKYIRNNKELYTQSGNRRSFNQLYDEYTLDNVVKQMKGKVRGEEGFFYGAGTIRSLVTPQFKSIEEIKANEHKLVTGSEMKNIKEEIDYELNNLSEAFKEFGGYSYDSYENALGDIARLKKITNNKAKEIFNEYGFNDVSNVLVDKSIEFLEKLKNAPTEYFEAKPQRAIGLDEVQALLVPSDIDSEFKQQLQDKGLNVVEYDKSIEGDKLSKINQFEDLKFSLSNNDIAPIGGDYRIYGNKALQEQGLIKEVESAIAPLQEKIQELSDKIDDIAPVNEKTLSGLEQEYKDSFDKITENDIPVRKNLTQEETKELDYLEAIPNLTDEEQTRLNELQTKENPNDTLEEDVISPFEDRDIKEVGKRNVKAYQYENPDVKPFFQEEAMTMLGDLQNSVKGQRMVVGDISQTGGGNYEFTGTKRHTADDIAYLLDEFGYSYADIEKGLKAIIEDHGAENIAVAKRIEFLLDERLKDGYTDVMGYKIPANADYKNTLKEIERRKLNEESQEYWQSQERKAFEQAVIESNKEIKKELGYIPKDPTKESSYDDMLDVFLNNREKNKKAEKVITKSKPKGKVRSLIDTTKNLLVNRNQEIDNLAKESGNQNIKYAGDMLNSVAGEIEGEIYTAQTDNEGREIGKSLKSLFEDVKRDGLYDAFNDYLEQYSNLDRYKQGKGSKTPYNVSEALVKKYERLHPEFKDYAQDVWNYGKNIKNNMVNAGLITQEFSDKLSEMYPHYVPYMENKEMTNFYPDIGEAKPIGVVKRAKGGASNLLSIEEALTKYTYASKKAVRQNQLYQEIVGTLEDKVSIGGDSRIDPTELSESLYKDENGSYLTAYVDGEQQSVRISDDLYKGLKNDLEHQVRDLEERLSLVTKPLQKASEIRRNLLTTWSPTFVITNPIKDIQDAVFNSKHTASMLKNYPTSFVELSRAKNPLAKQFLTLYGSGNTMGDYAVESGLNKGKVIQKNAKFLKGLSKLNNIVELAPRYAEFKASMEHGSSVQEAMYNAREITTNFNRGGVITKALNRNGATFLNASVQGFDKFIRNFSGENGAKGIASSLLKATMFGVVPAIFNELVFGSDDDKDEDYEALPDYIKDNYYLIKLDDNSKLEGNNVIHSGGGKFLRIPKGRALSVFGSSARRTIEYMQGEEDAFDGFLKNAITQVGVSDPSESNIFTPFMQAKENKAWYGGDIVPSRLQDLAPSEQYDASTDKFSIWLGDKLNISPYKINYVLDQYTGGLGDIALPLITEEATSSADSFGELLLAPIKAKFTANSTDDNKYAGDIYTLIDDMNTKPSEVKGTDEYQLQMKYLNNATSQMGELYKERREVQADTTLSKSEKYAKVQAIQQQINSIAKEGLDNYKNVSRNGSYASVGDEEYYKYTNEDGEEKWGKPKEDESNDLNSMGLDLDEKSSYYETKSTISSINAKYKNTDDYAGKKKEIVNTIKNANIPDEAKYSLYDKYYGSTDELKMMQKIGVKADNYLDYASQTFKADKDSNGKSITNSKKNKVFDYINSSDMTFEQKVILAKLEYNSYDEYNNEIIEYLNNNPDITYDDMEKILKKLGFEVDSQGNIKW